MTLYFISGLGADARAFQRIQFSKPIDIVHIQWIEPESKETFDHYCRRLAVQIDETKDFSLVGLSFGGMIAIELAKFLKPKKIILISSITNRNQLPLLYRMIGMLKLHRLLPGSLLKKPTFLMYWLFSLRKEDEKQLLSDFLKDISPNYLKWAIDQVLTWKNTFTPEHLFHIHGDKDRALPCRLTNPEKVVAGAGHFMVFTHAKEVSEYLEQTCLVTHPHYPG